MDEDVMSCFNALCRAYSISTRVRCSCRTLTLCFNALCRAYSISTFDNGMVYEFKNVVSMPCVGLTPFLRSMWHGCWA